MKCIFHGKESPANSIEHIVSESFGNSNYVIAKGAVCDECNTKFSKFEQKALSNSIFAFERARLGIKTKKGKAVKGKVENLEVEGEKNFTKQIVNIKGLDSANIQNYDQNKGTLEIHVSSFDKSEEAAAKLVLKMGIESLFQSQAAIYSKLNLQEAKDYLLNKNTKDWPFILSDYEPNKFKSIPTKSDKYELGIKKIKLEYLEINEDIFLVRFIFGEVKMVVNILNRNSDWINDFKINDKLSQIYPKHYRK